MGDKQIHRGFKIFLLLLIVGILFFANKDHQVKFIEAYQSLTTREKSLEKIKSIDLDSNIRVGFFDENIAQWDGDKLSIVDMNNNPIIEKQFNFETPEAIFGQYGSYIMDKSNGNIYIIDNKGETKERLILDHKIYNLLEEQDHIIVYTRSEEDENLVLFDNNGVLLRIHPVKDMSILTYNINEKNDRYLISNLNIQSVLKSHMTIYSMDGEEINKMDISDEIIIFTKFVNEDLIALTDKCLYYIKDHKIHWKKSFSNIKDIELQNNEIYLLYGDHLEILNLEGRTIKKSFLNEQYRKMTNSEKYILLWGDYNLLGLQGNKEILKYKHDTVIHDIILNKNYLGLMDSSTLHLFEVHNK